MNLKSRTVWNYWRTYFKTGNYLKILPQGERLKKAHSIIKTDKGFLQNYELKYQLQYLPLLGDLSYTDKVIATQRTMPLYA